MADQIVAELRGRQEDEIDLFVLGSDIWRQRWLVAAFVALSLVGAVVYLHRATYTYTAELKVTPAQLNTSAAGSRLGGLAGLASIAGVSLPQEPGAASFMLYKEGLKSRTVANALANRIDIMSVVFAGEWNPNMRRFVAPSKERGGPASIIKGFLGVPVYPWRAPDAARLQEYIKSTIEVSQDSDSPVTTIVFAHEDPEFAVKFLTALHQAVDNDLRRKARARSGEYIEYLGRQLQTVPVAEHRVALAQALSEQEKIRMMASSTMSFAAEPFGPATVSLRPTSPKPSGVIATCLAIGLVAGLLTATFRFWLARQNEVAPQDRMSPTNAH